jgi:diguanylate cyclase (GGDEF)-like protein
MLVLGLIVVAHTIALILNNVGIMTAFSIAHYKAVRNLSKQDSLTGLLNRRGFFELYQTKSNRYQSVAVISCDIDFFKTVNDNHGHNYGDKILEKVAIELKHHTKANFKKESLVARWGGEEFIIALFDSSLKQARLLADTLREVIHNNEYQVNGKCFNISLSFGVAYHKVETLKIEDIINESDKALYHAKSHGRNQVSCQSDIIKHATTELS